MWRQAWEPLLIYNLVCLRPELGELTLKRHKQATIL